MLRYWTAGESHGKALVALVDGFPAGLAIGTGPIDEEFRRRQGGYGRGGRQRIETDHVEILSGVWQGTTLGSPIALLIPNKDYKLERMEDLEAPRPGHGDLSGAMKYLAPIRAILERASARETAARVAAGGLAGNCSAQFGITPLGYVVELGPMRDRAAARHFGRATGPPRPERTGYSLDPGRDEGTQAAHRHVPEGRRHAGWRDRGPGRRGCPSASARTPNGMRSSTGGSPRR